MPKRAPFPARPSCCKRPTRIQVAYDTVTEQWLSRVVCDHCRTYGAYQPSAAQAIQAFTERLDLMPLKPRTMAGAEL